MLFIHVPASLDVSNAVVLRNLSVFSFDAK